MNVGRQQLPWFTKVSKAENFNQPGLVDDLSKVRREESVQSQCTFGSRHQNTLSILRSFQNEFRGHLRPVMLSDLGVDCDLDCPQTGYQPSYILFGTFESICRRWPEPHPSVFSGAQLQTCDGFLYFETWTSWKHVAVKLQHYQCWTV